jgi:hypothetical protein
MDWVISLLVINSNQSIAINQEPCINGSFLLLFRSKFLFLTQTSCLSTSEGEASFFLFLENKAFTPNHQFGRQEKDFIHQASNFFELVKIGGNIFKNHPSSMKTITSIHPHEVYWLMVIPQFHCNLFEIEEILLMACMILSHVT